MEALLSLYTKITGQEKNLFLKLMAPLVVVFLVPHGDPPALLGRHAKFDNSGSPIVTPKCEPPSNTQGRNHETSEQFKSHPMGV
jgi:hypothetical protein